MKEFDLMMIIDFLEANYMAFQSHIENIFQLDSSEAENIIDDLKKERERSLF
ncbi:MAG: hypothetical protein SWH54_00370 [Thermodesulfobacteriota bacterium]|nr:hypothetical protein [Thermodesulfobacteriota bacterium]